MSEQKPLGFLLLDGARWFAEGLAARLAASGLELTRAEAQVLVALEDEGQRTSELGRRLGVSRQAAHQVVRGLTASGHVRQVVDPRNHSAKRVQYTAKGREAATAVRKVFADMEWDLAIRVGPMRVANLRRALEPDWGPTSR